MPATRPDRIDDRTPLMLAACADDLCTLFEVILEGADVDAQDADGWTALTHACAKAHYEIAQQLLDSGAGLDVQESNSMKDTPLSMAAQCGNFDLVRLLIHRGADPNRYAGIMAVTAECYARRGGFREISEFLRDCEDKQRRSNKLP